MAGEYALELGVPFVSIDCACDHPLSITAEAIIVSGEFRNREYPCADLTELFAEYQQRAQGLVVFTVGSETILYGRKVGPIQRFQPYPVQVVDSAGAGDLFRAGIIYGLLKRWTDVETIRYASALAGLVCSRFPGVLNSPTHEEVTQFMESAHI